MYPLMITLVFLSLLGILTSSEIKSFASSQVEKALHESYLKSKQELQIAQTAAHFQDRREDTEEEAVKEKTPPNPEPKQSSSVKRPIPLNVNLARPPNNSRLNLALLINGHTRKIDEQFSYYEITARLIRKLYGHTTFFQEIPNCEYQILNQLIANKDDTKIFTNPDELAKIAFENPKLQKAFYHMMKGSSLEGNSFRSLLNYITFDTPQQDRKWTAIHHRINFMYTSKEILDVIFDNQDVVQALLTYRNKLWSMILQQEEKRLTMTKEEGLTRTLITQELTQVFKETLASNGFDPKLYSSLFTFSLSKPGTVLLVHDAETNIIIREKIEERVKK